MLRPYLGTKRMWNMKTTVIEILTDALKRFLRLEKKRREKLEIKGSPSGLSRP